MINDLNLKSQSLPPRGIVKINDQFILFKSLTINTQNYYIADTVTLEIPLYNNPPFDLNFWSSVEKIEIEVYTGFPTNVDNFNTSDLDLMFVGIIDNIDINPFSGLVHISGRDFSALMIDDKATDSLGSKTSSEVATALAKKHNLTPVVTKTTQPIGTFFNNEYNFVISKFSEWDLLTFLAQQEEFNVFVTGRELHYKPKATGGGETYGLKINDISHDGGQLKGSMKNIVLSRGLTLARDVIVKIQSFDQNTLTTNTAVAKSTHTKGSSKFKTQTYNYSIPSLNLDQANARAKAILRDITQNEILMSVSLPGDNLLNKQSVVELVGSGTRFNQIYFVQSIQRTLNFDGTYSMNVIVKNHSIDTQVDLQ